MHRAVEGQVLERSESSGTWEWLERSAAPAGFRAAGVRAGIKTTGSDVALLVADSGAASAALFTQNQFCAPPVLVSREHALRGDLRAIVANSGCANCCTGDQGLADAREMARLAAGALGLRPEQILVASTGIIGHPLPMPKITAGIAEAAEQLSLEGFADAAEAIMTTDTGPKQAALRVRLGEAPVVIAGMVKGAGMVAPRMEPPTATVFAFFATDVNIASPVLQPIFGRVMARSLNRVTVDGDTSTNDTACILASGAAGGAAIEAGSEVAAAFEAALTAVAQDLARQMARGGEGANHLITIRVSGANTEADAEAIALCIANSPLVKTAIFGKDPNWGRIAMAAGRAGVPFDQSRVDIYLNGFAMALGGARAEFDANAVHQSLDQDEITVEVRLQEGNAEATTWTCDFSYDYVKINAEYHT